MSVPPCHIHVNGPCCHRGNAHPPSVLHGAAVICSLHSFTASSLCSNNTKWLLLTQPAVQWFSFSPSSFELLYLPLPSLQSMCRLDLTYYIDSYYPSLNLTQIINPSSVVNMLFIHVFFNGYSFSFENISNLTWILFKHFVASTPRQLVAEFFFLKDIVTSYNFFWYSCF